VSSPTFPKRDPGGPEFWDLRYQAHFAPWDAGKVPAQLREFVTKFSLPLGGGPGWGSQSVLVPGCGSAHDVRFFAESGCQVLGIDFSSEAIAAAREILGPHAGRVRIADFFAPLPEAPFAVVYERAFLCALPRRLWQDWAARVGELLPSGGLLAGFFFFDAADRGPPFPLHSGEELAALLEGAFTRIEDQPAADSIAVFAGRERWQVWRRR
jgi:SAM-dependent methyltransferase